MKLIFFLCTASILAFANISTAKENALLNKIQNKINITKGFSANFEQRNFDSLSSKTRFAKGIVKFLNPGLMRWEYAPPEDQLIIIGKKQAWIYDPIMENVTVQNLKGISGLNTIGFLRGTSRLEEEFTFVNKKKLAKKDKGLLSVELVPKKKNNHVKKLTLILNQYYRINRIKIEDSEQNYRIITFKDFKYKPLPKSSEFTFIISDAMELIN